MKKKYAGSSEILDIQVLSASEKVLLPKNAHRNARMRKAWKDRIAEIITPDTRCSICGGASVLQIHHETIDAYKVENFNLYETLSPLLPFKVICKKCHWASHNGMILCKLCGERYHLKTYDSCFPCSGKESTEIFKAIGFDLPSRISTGFKV